MFLVLRASLISPCLIPSTSVFIKIMLFDPDVVQASKGRMWQEGREGGERLMRATVKQRKTGVGECYLETRGGSLHLRG
jgi:hypothetical protein